MSLTSRLFSLLFFSYQPAHRELLSFPTRRSSDLAETETHDDALFPADLTYLTEALEEVLETPGAPAPNGVSRSEEHTSELQSRGHLVCRLLLEKKRKQRYSEEQGRYREGGD